MSADFSTFISVMQSVLGCKTSQVVWSMLSPLLLSSMSFSIAKELIYWLLAVLTACSWVPESFFGDLWSTFWWSSYVLHFSDLYGTFWHLLIPLPPWKSAYLLRGLAVLAACRWWDVSMHQSACTNFFIMHHLDKNPDDRKCIFPVVYSSVFSSCLLVLFCSV